MKAPANRYEWLRTVRDGGAVKRLHVVRTISTQTNAAHQWGVAMLLMAVEADTSLRLMRRALTHDVHEVHTGDPPATVKWNNRDLAIEYSRMESDFETAMNLFPEGLSENESKVMAWADCFELAQHCLEELKMGNTFVIPVLANCTQALARMIRGMPLGDSAEVGYNVDVVKELTSALFAEARAKEGRYVSE